MIRAASIRFDRFEIEIPKTPSDRSSPFFSLQRDDTSLLAQFFYADESLNAVACELDSFDGRQEPERCTTLVNQLRHCQDKVLTICNQIMDDLIPESRANRDFRVKFPDDVMQENLAGQLWFGAECLAAGSSIMNREAESSAMRPLAKALTKSLEIVRNLLREHALKGHMNLKVSMSVKYKSQQIKYVIQHSSQPASQPASQPVSQPASQSASQIWDG